MGTTTIMASSAISSGVDSLRWKDLAVFSGALAFRSLARFMARPRMKNKRMAIKVASIMVVLRYAIKVDRANAQIASTVAALNTAPSVACCLYVVFGVGVGVFILVVPLSALFADCRCHTRDIGLRCPAWQYERVWFGMRINR